MKHLLTLLILLFALPLLAQETMPDHPATDALATYQQPAQIDRVRVQPTDDTTLIRVNGFPAGCDILQQTQAIYGTVIVIDLYVYPHPDDRLCDPAPFEALIDVGQLEIDRVYTILINDFASQFFIPRRDATPMDVPAQILDWDVENALAPHQREDVRVDRVQATLDGDALAFEIVGGINGCPLIEAPLVSYTRPDTVDADLYHVELFRLHPAERTCPDDGVTVTPTINTGIAPTSSTTVMLADAYYKYTALNAPLGGAELVPVTRQYLDNRSVSITPTETGYTVTYAGMQSGECGVPLETAQYSDDFVSVVNLYTDIPLAAACTRNLVPIERRLTVPSVPVIVNGVLHTLDADENKRDQDTDGNTSQVDIVVENVTVNVLESAPPQLSLEVSGYIQDGCDFPIQIEQDVRETAVTIRIYRQVPTDVMCPAVIVDYAETITVDGRFSGDSVTVTVNDITTRVDF